MKKIIASARVNVRACDYQRILNDLLDRQPCDRWLKSWADANWDWVYGDSHNLKARQLVDMGTGAAQQQALEAYNDCLAGNPITQSAENGISIRVGTRLADGTLTSSKSSGDKMLTQRLAVNFGGEVVAPPDCPPVSEAVFMRDEYEVTWFGHMAVDPQGTRNYRFEIVPDRDFSAEWASRGCPDYEDYYCYYGAPREMMLFALRLKISRLYELIRAAISEKSLPPDAPVAPYALAPEQTSDNFMTYQGFITQSPLLAQFVFEYFNAETGELTWQYPHSNGSDFQNGWFPLMPDNQSGNGTGAKSEPWWGLAPSTPPGWGNWTVRCICLGVRMRLESWPQGIPIQHPDLLMAKYPLPGGGSGGEPQWRLETGLTAYTPGMTDGLAKFERQDLKVAFVNHSYRCEIAHVRVLEGIGYLYTITFTNDTKFDFWYAYRAANVAYYRSNGSHVWGPAGNYPLMFHLPPFSTRAFWVLQPLEGYWLDWKFLGDMAAPTPWVNTYHNLLHLISSAAPVKPAVAESLWADVRDGNGGTRKAIINYLSDSNQVRNWYACSTYPPTSTLASHLQCDVVTVESGVSGQRLGWSYSLAAYVTYRDADGKTYSATQYFSWGQMSAALGLPSATHIEIPLDGTGHKLVRNIGWWGGTSQGYCVHALVNRCDYWSSWDEFKTRVNTAVRGLLPGSWTVLTLDLRNPYVGFDFVSVPLNDPGWGARSGIVPSVSESVYPSRITVRV